jgi:hypothetical protein
MDKLPFPLVDTVAVFYAINPGKALPSVAPGFRGMEHLPRFPLQLPEQRHYGRTYDIEIE